MSQPPLTMTVEEFRATYGKGAAPKPRYRTHANLDGMNKTEAAWAAELDYRKAAGELRGWLFEPFKLRLAAKTYYSPDFLLWMADGSFEIDEVKGGRIEDDAMVKLKTAARLFPMFRFVLCQRKTAKGGFETREIPDH